MNRKLSVLSCFLATLMLMTGVQLVLAHNTIIVGDYEIEVGWLIEPPIAGQENAIVVHVVDTSDVDEQPVEDVSSLTLTLSYGGQTKAMDLVPLGEDQSGQFMSPVIPTIPGEYEVIFGGTLGETEVDAETHVEEVQPASVLEFPAVEHEASAAGNNWLVWLSLLVGLIGVGLGVTALRKQ